MPSAPLCERNPTLPSGGHAAAKVPFIAISGEVFTTPMQFGPTRRIPAARQTSSSSAWRARPSAPLSPNPAEITTSPCTPFSPHAFAMSTTYAAGTATNATSTGPGTSAIVAYAGTPCTASAVAFTGYTTPVNGRDSRLWKSLPPIEDGSRDAPITAIDVGSSSARTAFAAATRSRSS